MQFHYTQSQCITKRTSPVPLLQYNVCFNIVVKTRINVLGSYFISVPWGTLEVDVEVSVGVDVIAVFMVPV